MRSLLIVTLGLAAVGCRLQVNDTPKVARPVPRAVQDTAVAHEPAVDAPDAAVAVPDATVATPEPAVATPEPFGFVFGQARPSVEFDCKDIADMVMQCAKAPRPVSDVRNYALVFDEGKLIKAGAFFSVQNDTTGVKTRLLFKRLAAAITAKYGSPKDEWDFLHAGSIWKESHYFCMSLLKEERTLATTWSVAGVAIMLSVAGVSSNDTMVQLTYEDKAGMKRRLQKKASRDVQGL